LKVSANGIEIGYDVFGEGDGDVVILVMGIGAQRIVWHDDLCAEFVARGFRLIRLDNRDVGESTWLNDQPAPSPLRATLRALLRLPVAAPYSLSDMAADVVGLMDGLDIDKAHVIGASMGGMICQHLAIEHPDRLLSMTSMMAGPGTARHMLGKPSALRALLSGPAISREEAMDLNEALFRVIGGTLPMDVNFIRERAGMSWDRGHNAQCFPRHWAAIMASGRRLRALRGVRVPSLVIHGKVDPLVPMRAARATASAIPGCRTLYVDGMGHDMPRSTWPQITDAFQQLATARPV
jgi:pimeloyl-ACP methyl ester carboxylesterase